MLNAFRHHGLYRATWMKAMATACMRCSTPFGITDYIGLRAVSLGRVGPVLCSTPFGITDYIGCRRPDS